MASKSKTPKTLDRFPGCIWLLISAAFRVFYPAKPLDVSAAKLMAKDDHRKPTAEYGESMLALSRWVRRLALPAAILWATPFLVTSALTDIRWLVTPALLGVPIFLVMATSTPRIPTDTDFRRPILVLRSYQEREIVDSVHHSDSEYSFGGWQSQIWHMAEDLWDWPRFVFFLSEDTLNEMPIHGIEVRPDDDDWEDEFERSVELSWFVLVFPASTKSCKRELRLLSVFEALDKVIVVMPPGSRAGEGWEKVRITLNEMGVRLPPHDFRGKLYLPYANYSIRRSVRLKGKMNWKKVLKLVPAFSSLPDFPLSQVLPHPFFEHGRGDLGEGGLRVAEDDVLERTASQLPQGEND